MSIVKQMSKIKILLLVVVTLGLTGCNFQELSFEGVEDVKIIKVDTKGVEAQISAVIYNPNKVSFTIYKSEVDVKLNGIDVGRAFLTEKVNIEKQTKKAYTFNVESDFSKLSVMELPKALGMALQSKLNVSLSGNIKAGKLFVKKNIPVNVSKVVPLN